MDVTVKLCNYCYHVNYYHNYSFCFSKRASFQFLYFNNSVMNRNWSVVLTVPCCCKRFSFNAKAAAYLVFHRIQFLWMLSFFTLSCYIKFLNRRIACFSPMAFLGFICIQSFDSVVFRTSFCCNYTYKSFCARPYQFWSFFLFILGHPRM